MRYSTQQLIEMAHRYICRNYAPSDDFVLRKGRGCWLYDTEGNRYLDMLACYSANNFGNGNWRVVFAKIKQEVLRGMMTNANCYWEENKILFCKEIAEFCDMDRAIPMNSGAEAVETAMKIARKWAYTNTKKHVVLNQAEIIFCINNFHGRTLGVLSGSTTPEYTSMFGPFIPDPYIKKILFGDAVALENAVNENTAAFIFEPIQGEGGIIIPPDGYIKAVRDICTRHNVMMIADEVQSGFGRTGRVFACDHEGVKPDAYVLGKAIGGGGDDLSVVVGKEEFMNVFVPGDHGSTFGGNPLACAVGLVVLKMMRESHPERHAAEMGEYFVDGLWEIAKKNGHIAEIRNRGLWVGLEVKKGGPKAHDICVALYKEGVLCKETHEHTIRFSPPLTITKKELDWALERIERVFTE